MNTDMTDKEYIADSVTSQKHISESYNSCANECANSNLKDQFLSILKEEHDIQHDLFVEMQNRGWYVTTQAPQNKIDQTKTKFASI